MAFCPKTHATNTECCPVRLYLTFASHRPDVIKKPDAPFFLAVNHNRVGLISRYGTIEQPSKKKNKIGEFLTKAAKKKI